MINERISRPIYIEEYICVVVYLSQIREPHFFIISDGETVLGDSEYEKLLDMELR